MISTSRTFSLGFFPIYIGVSGKPSLILLPSLQAECLQLLREDEELRVQRSVRLLSEQQQRLHL